MLILKRPGTLTGSVDRVERDPDGRIRIVDFKTSKTAPTAADVALYDQLGVYQLAVQHGAFAAVAGEDARPGGAELVYLRLSEGNSGHPKTFQQASLDDAFPGDLEGRRGRTWRTADLGTPAAGRCCADHSQRTS